MNEIWYDYYHHSRIQPTRVVCIMSTTTRKSGIVLGLVGIKLDIGLGHIGSVIEIQYGTIITENLYI